MESLYIVMPAYNEEDNIDATVVEWYRILEGKDDSSRLVVADSGSTDTTHHKLVELKKKYPKLEILENTDRFHGPKVIALYDYAVKNGADYIFQTDSDGQTDPKEFEKFWKQRKRYDAVIGYRTIRGDGKSRAFVERVVCFLLRLYFGVKVPDANAPFRLMKADVVEKYLHRLDSDYDIPNIMMTTFFVYYQEKTLFMSISFSPRRAGNASLSIKKIIGIGLKALGDFRRLKKGM